ncbi:hypothetical protein JVU11DRAFT_6773 [Chiua virens]|nr:hypothetical protein JVU11DRAFT_6773 [Chiua virens]
MDEHTGEITYQCLQGNINNYNETMLQAICCNMDLKFIGSGPAAKAMMYYVTNYITKSQLKAHIAYAALELACKKVELQSSTQQPSVEKSKQLLQKCAYAMLSHQELSAQQVASYLLSYEDHFTSHRYCLLYWMLWEHKLNGTLPSPEYSIVLAASSNGTVTSKVTLFEDYTLQSNTLAFLYLWDFTRHMDKIKKH